MAELNKEFIVNLQGKNFCNIFRIDRFSPPDGIKIYYYRDNTIPK